MTALFWNSALYNPGLYVRWPRLFSTKNRKRKNDEKIQTPTPGSTVPLLRETFLTTIGRLRYVESLSPQLIASVTWRCDLCCLSLLLLLLGTSAVTVGLLSFVETLVASATWDLGCFCYAGLDGWISCRRFVRLWLPQLNGLTSEIFVASIT